MTEIASFADGGVLQETDLFVVSRAGVGRRMSGSRIASFDASGNLTIPGSGAVLSASNLRFSAGGSESARITSTGRLVVGATSGSNHRVSTPGVAQATYMFSVDQGTFNSLIVQSVGAEGFSTAGAALWAGRNTTTSRSINAGGTINASGADYAEYMTKAEGCGIIQPGDVCGVDGEGLLTKTWANAISFVIKSTNPSLVGGDDWTAGMPPRPEDEDDLPAWEAELEARREGVDRIAFAGQVPVNVEGEFAVGDYLVAAANGGGIKAVAVPESEITFEQYRRRLGKIWAIRDGRPWVDVQHG